MANEVNIDVVARFVDNVTDEAKAAAKSFEGVEKAAEGAKKDIDALGKTNAKPKVTMDADRAAKKLNDLDKKLNKIGKSKTEAKLSVMDKATALIDKVTAKAKAFAGKTYSGLVKLRDSNVLSTLNKMSNGLKSLTSKAFSVAVKIKDTFTAPLTKLKNMLFNVRTLIAGIASAWAAVKIIKNPIDVADAYSSAKIGFSTLLGDSAGQKMMDDLDEFAKATPFKTTNVIANAQKMMAMGWDVENIIEDMETIGNAAAATGKMDQGLESIVRALSQIKTKGKLSTEELNQLAEAGIAAKSMLAENLGYGTGDGGIAKMTEDLEKGAIASDVAIQALMAGMQKYDGMMDSMANETVEGLISQMQDAFEISVVRKWGQGLQDGAKRGFGTIVDLLDEAEEALANFGDMLYEIGKTASNWVADKLQSAVEKITEISGSFEFENADLKGKISMLWNGLIVDPLQEWWDNGGRDKTIESAGKIGSWMGEAITKGLLAIFGVTDFLDTENTAPSAGAQIAESFVNGFKENFDGKAITDAFVDAIGNVWGALPTWAKVLIGGYGTGVVAGGISKLAGGITNFLGTAGVIGAGNAVVGGSGLLGVIGKTGVAGVGASGIMGGLANTGYILMGGTSALSVGGGMAALAGAGGIAGGIAGVAALGKGAVDLYRGYTTDDEVEAKASKASGWTAIGGVGAGAAAGAAIGSVVPVLGTALGALIGAGVGGIAGWIGGNAWANEIRKTDDAVNDVTTATEKLETEEEKLAKKAKMVWQNMKDHFGDIKLSMSEIQTITEQIVWGNDLGYFEQFTMAAQTAEASLESLKGAAETTNRWLWKASLGMTFDTDDKESIIASFDEYIAGAQSYLENKHYEFTAAVSLLVDTESDAGKSILGSGNAFYGKLQEQLDSLGEELSGKVEIALQDGVITLDEHDEIVNLQKQIAEITQKVSDAETTAELELIKVKFGKARMDLDSFDSFMEQMEVTLSERMAANDEAFKVSISSLELQLAEGAISQEEYNAQLQAILDGYAANAEELKARIMNVELEIIGDAYAKDGVTAEKLQNALERSLKDNIDPITWTADQARAYLGLDTLQESSADAISQMLGALADQLDLVQIPMTIDPVETVNPLNLSSGDFGIKSTYSFAPTVNINPNVRTATTYFRLQSNGSGYRGGIFGGSFARGGEVDNSGIVGGSTRFIRVNEESPEMIIPLSDQRRGRALKLWAQAGNIMGVPGFARGGIIGGNNTDEGFRFKAYGGDSAGGRTVHVEVGGVKLEINVSGSDREGIVEAIKAQAGDLADYFVGLIADALETEFENTPVRGGA